MRPIKIAKMDKNTVIGLLLIFLLFLGFSFYQTNRNQKIREAQEKQLAEQIARQAEDTAALTLTADTAIAATAAGNPALTAVQQFSNPQIADTNDYVVETAKAVYYFGKKGGCLRKAMLKDVYRYTPKDSAKQPLVLFEDGSNEMGIQLMLRDQTEVNTLDCYFLSEDTDTLVVDEKNNTLSLRIYPNVTGDAVACQTQDATSYIEYLYTFAPDDYRYSFKIRLRYCIIVLY